MVRAPVERLEVTGFRFEGEETDDAAWGMWQDNGLDAESRLVHTESTKNGISYVLIDPDGPTITGEHPSQMIVETAPGNRRIRLAALKKWCDEYGYGRANVYLPEAVYRYRSAAPLKNYGARKINWAEDDIPIVVNPLRSVPVVPFANDPSMLGGGQSDLSEAIDIQNAVNKLVSDLIIASEYQSFKQRWATGIEIPKDPDTGEPLETDWKQAANRIWSSENSEARFGEFGQADLNNYVVAVEMLIQHLAAQTRTPRHYLFGQSGQLPSGEALKSSEAGLVAKVRAKHADFSDPWEEVMRLAFRAQGDETRATENRAETLWADPESRSQAEVTDAAVKMLALQVPFRDIWRFIGATPQEVDRWWDERGGALRASAPTSSGEPS